MKAIINMNMNDGEVEVFNEAVDTITYRAYKLEDVKDYWMETMAMGETREEMEEYWKTPAGVADLEEWWAYEIEAKDLEEQQEQE